MPGAAAPQRFWRLLSQGESIPIQLDIYIDAEGGIHYLHGDGAPMSDDEARVMRRHARESLRGQLERHCERLNADLDRLGSWAAT